MPFIPKAISQRDPRWKDEKLGFDTKVVIGTHGCALACLTMLVNGYGFNETPSSMNRKLKDMGSGNGFVGSLIVWAGLTRAFPGILFRRIVVSRDQPASLGPINASLDAGQALVVEVDQSPEPGLQNHWVVLYARQGNDYLMLDPWPQPPDNGPVTLASRFGHGRDPRDYITAAVWYEAIGVSPLPPGEGLFVRVQAAVTAGLRLRSAPNTSSTTLAIEPAGTPLRCLEPDEVAIPKIGVDGQWLRVRDPAGLDGHVAAWYVEKVGEPAPAPAPQPPPEPEPEPQPEPEPAPTQSFTVLVSQSVGAAGLRLRSEPNTGSATLTILRAGSELAVLETEAQARVKVGQMNQWINVRDGGGRVGYVAAWYVALKPAALTVVVSSTASAGLRLRDQPNLNSNILKAVMPGTSLIVLEPGAEAKIGVEGQWLNVRDPAGQAGYVAAWYVQK